MLNKQRAAALSLVLCNMLIAFLYVRVLSETDLFAFGRLQTYDALTRLRASHALPQSHVKDVVLVTVDDESFVKLNRSWPWTRDTFAIFLDELRKFSPKAVALDFSFVGRNPNESFDYWLADGVTRSKNVILASYFDLDGSYIRPMAILEKNALACGFVDQTVDRDAISRRVRILRNTSDDNRSVFSFAIETAYAFIGGIPLRDITPFSEYGWKFETPAGVHDVWADHSGRAWLSYRYPIEDLKTVSFWKLLRGQAKKEDFEGKIVLVGGTSMELQDYRPTPLGLMAGIVIHANELLMILDHDFIRPVPLAVEEYLLLILAAGFTILFLRLRNWMGVVLYGLALMVISAIGIVLFVSRNVFYDIFSALFVLTLIYMVTLVFRMVRLYIEKSTLQRMAIMDGLTGLYGYRYLMIRLEAEFNKALREHTAFYLAMVDIDLFKQVNDSYGHEMGNRVLAEVASVLKSGIRGYDVAARYGGEEFTLILFNHDERTANQTLERIRHAMEEKTFTAHRTNFHVTISAGLCSSQHPDVKSKDDMIRFADAALYQAKQKGRNRVKIYVKSLP